MRNGDVSRPRGFGQRGFGYLLVLFALAAMGLLLAGAGQVWHTAAQREKEAELLFAGNQFRQAIGSYHERTPGAAKQYPAKLEDLLEDKRFPVPRRHLRKLYRDPMTGSEEWGLVKAGGRIVGVHSLSGGKPFKAVFSGRNAAFAGASRYDQWVFGPEVAEAASGAALKASDAAAPPGAASTPNATPATPVTPVAESHPCDTTYLDEFRLCTAGAAVQTAAQPHRCNAIAAARYAACREGG